jgi:hypothetical protein
MQKIKLYFDGKINEVPTNVASFKLKNIFIDKLEKISTNALSSKLMKLVADGELENGFTETEMIQKAIEKKLVDVSEFLESAEKINTKDKIYRELAVELIDTKQLTTKQKEIFSDDADSDFWLSQDVNEIEDAVNSFRTSFKLQTF